MVVTAPESKISSRMSSTFVAQPLLLLQSWKVEAWWPGAIPTMVVTAPESKISWGILSRFVTHTVLLLRSWQMEPWWPGGVPTMVVTARESKISLATYRSMPRQKWQVQPMDLRSFQASQLALTSPCFCITLRTPSGLNLIHSDIIGFPLASMCFVTMVRRGMGNVSTNLVLYWSIKHSC